MDYLTQMLANAAGANREKIYVEDVFSTYLYTGSGSEQTINNGIALGNGATNGTILQLSDTLTDLSPVPSSVTNVNGGVSVVSSPVKFGSNSFRFLPANSGWLYAVLSRSIDIYDDFCIEFWQNSASTDETGYVTGTVSNSTNQWQLRSSSGQMRFWIGGTVYMTASLPTANQWNHIAFTGTGTTIQLFYNGSLVGSVATETLVSSGNRLIGATPQLLFGATVAGGSIMDGYMDDIRVTSGRSVYTSSFTAPTAALPLDTLVVGRGGMIWLKERSNSSTHNIYDTIRGPRAFLESNSNLPNQTYVSPYGISAFSTGFSLDSGSNAGNNNGSNYVSWTFRKQPKFFDVVTYTGNGDLSRSIPHNLGSTPGFIIVKRTDSTSFWYCWHKDYTGAGLYINSNGIFPGDSSAFSTTQSSTTLNTLGNGTANINGATYVAYLFAHNAGGFGDSGTDNVISCGSFTTDGSANATVTLGWEPQWVLIKPTSRVDDWKILDNMRGWEVGSNPNGDKLLIPNSITAEQNTNYGDITPTGFTFSNASNETSIYIAIRRGLMNPNTNNVIGAVKRYGSNINTTLSGNRVSDSVLIRNRSGIAAGGDWVFVSRLTGKNRLSTSANTAEVEVGPTVLQENPWDVMTGVKLGTTSALTNSTSWQYIYYFFTRAYKFYDIVCYTGTGNNRTVNHNLGVAPELMFIKRRDGTDDWRVYDISTGNTKYQVLNSQALPVTSTEEWNNTTPTSSVFTVGTGTSVNSPGASYIAHLFASSPGRSKIGSYIGNESTQTIDCGFTTGARIVIIKGTNNSLNFGWVILDVLRGISFGSEVYLRLNLSTTELSGDVIDPAPSGFTVKSAANINLAGWTYTFFAIA